MKLNTHQKRYYQFFKLANKYRKDFNGSILNYNPWFSKSSYFRQYSHRLNILLNAYNMNLPYVQPCTGKVHKISPQEKLPFQIEIEIEIHGTKCMIQISAYSEINLFFHCTKDEWNAGNIILRHRIDLYTDTNGSNFYTYHDNTNKNIEIVQVLNSTIYDNILTEEQFFQLQCITQNPELYSTGYIVAHNVFSTIMNPNCTIENALTSIFKSINSTKQYKEYINETT